MMAENLSKARCERCGELIREHRAYFTGVPINYEDHPQAPGWTGLYCPPFPSATVTVQAGQPAEGPSEEKLMRREALQALATAIVDCGADQLTEAMDEVGDDAVEYLAGWYLGSDSAAFVERLRGVQAEVRSDDTD